MFINQGLSLTSLILMRHILSKAVHFLLPDSTLHDKMPDSYQQLNQIIVEILWVQVRSVAKVGPCFEEVTGLNQPLAEQGKVILESEGESHKRIIKAQKVDICLMSVKIIDCSSSWVTR